MIGSSEVYSGPAHILASKGRFEEDRDGREFLRWLLQRIDQLTQELKALRSEEGSRKKR